MTEKNQFYSLNGNVRIAKYDNAGVLGKYWNVGNVSSFNLAIKEDIVEERETQTGGRGVIVTIPNGTTATLTTTLKELNRENLEVALRGVTVADTISTVTDAAIALTFAEYTSGIREVVLPDLNLSTVVVKDALAATVTVNTNGAAFGVISLPDGMVTGQFPLHVSYTSGVSNSLGFLTQAAGTYSIRFEGVNTVVGGASHKMLTEFYKVSFSPAQALELLAADAKVTTMDLEGKVLIDTSKTASNDLGQFGRSVTI